MYIKHVTALDTTLSTYVSLLPLCSTILPLFDILLFHTRKMDNPTSNAPHPTAIPTILMIRLVLFESSLDPTAADGTVKQEQ